jgi:multiple sugar transport system permease protein
MSLSASPRVRRPRRRTRGWGFVAPYFAFLIIFGIVPVGYALVTSFSVTPEVGDAYFSFTKNFSDVLSDFRLPQATLNVTYYMVLWLPIMLIVIFGLALVMDAKRTRFVALTRFVIYVPGAITGSAAALVWFFMFSPVVSPFAFLLKPFSPSNGELVNDQTLPIILTVLGIAIGTGGWLVVVLGALSALPADVLEAAKIDGVNAWQLVWYIKLPLIRSYIVFILVVLFAAGFQVIVEPTVLASGAMGQVSSTWSINELVYAYASGESNYGRASALALILLAICIGIALLVITRTRFYKIGDR